MNGGPQEPRVAKIAALVMGIAIAALSPAASAADRVRFAKGFPTLFQFTPIDVGIEQGIFAKYGLEIELSAFTGDAKTHQAFAAGAIDMAIGSGPGLAFVAKGSPVLGVAEAADRPLGITLSVEADSPYKTIADLKGQTISGASVGDQTQWMVRELSRLQGWGPEGFNYVGLGGVEAQLSALRTHQVAAVPFDITTATQLEDKGEVRILVKYGDVVKEYINHVIYASNDLIAKHPEDVRNFLAAWFETVAYFKTHKQAVIDADTRVLKMPAPILSRVYDEAVGMITDDGHFDPKGLAVLRRSFVEMNILPEAPDMSRLYTEKFLPGPVR
jgi:ABC-type nitrate/sulfonate/bicarbonate transport system substrate-binding protein